MTKKDFLEKLKNTELGDKKFEPLNKGIYILNSDEMEFINIDTIETMEVDEDNEELIIHIKDKVRYIEGCFQLIEIK